MQKLRFRSVLTALALSGVILSGATLPASAIGNRNTLSAGVFKNEILARSKAPARLDSLTSTCQHLDRLIDFYTDILETGTLNIGRARYGLVNYQLEAVRQRLRDAQETYSHLQCSAFV